MTDEPDPPPTVVAFPSKPSFAPVSERGARPPPLPPPEPDPPEKLGLFSPEMTLRDLLTEAMQGDYSKPDWSVAEVLRVIDPGEKSPAAMRIAARFYLRKIAGEIALNRERPTMRSGASYAVIADIDRPEPPKREALIPPRHADLRLDAAKAGPCNLCGKRHSDGLFVMTWVEPSLNAPIRAQFGAACVTQAIVAAIRRRNETAVERAEKAENRKRRVKYPWGDDDD